MSNAASETLDGSLAASAGASRDKGQIIDPNGLDLFRLTMMVITASICGGIFALAGDMAAGGASTGAVLISWAICFVGVFSLMMCFNGLSQARPDLTGGIYAYAAAGFGDFVGFNSAWGYWVSACLSSVSFAILLFSALGYFFHPFESGNNLLSCVCASAFLWLLVWLVSRGVKEAAGINVSPSRSSCRLRCSCCPSRCWASSTPPSSWRTSGAKRAGPTLARKSCPP